MISIVKQPDTYTPSNNPIIFQVESDNLNIVYFQAQVIDVASNSVINQLNIFPTPATLNGSYVNLSRLLSNTVKTEVLNDNSLIQPLPNAVRSYQLKLVEYVLSSNNIVSGQTYTSPVNFVWDADLSRNEFTAYSQGEYVINSGTTLASFLTDKPATTTVNELGSEQLYAITSIPNVKARVRFYSSSNVLLDIITQSVTGATQMFRLEVSPSVVKLLIGTPITSVAYYVVDILDAANNPVIKPRNYIIKPIECYSEYVNVSWINQRGGLDSYQFVAPQETLNVVNFKLKRNIYGIDSEGKYSDTNNGMYNATDVILNNTATSQVKLTTKPLKDNEAYWLQSLYQSKQVFINDAAGNLIPVTLLNTTYQIPRLRYKTTELNLVSVDLQLTDSYIPRKNSLITSPLYTGETYYNEVRFSAITRNNCFNSQQPTTVVYTVSANTYTSFISVDDANDKADNDILLNGQIYANTYGFCTAPLFTNTTRSAHFKNFDCVAGSAGSTGVPFLFTVSASTYGSNTSQNDANAKADRFLYRRGQNNATIFGICTTESSNSFVGIYTKSAAQSAAELSFQDVYYVARAQTPVNTTITITFQYSLDGGATWSSNLTTTILLGAQISNQQLLTTTTSGNGIFVQTRIISISPSSFGSQVYTYAGFSGSTGTTFYNAARTIYWNKQDCITGSGSTVTRTIAASAFTSTISQEDVEAQVSQNIALTGDDYANTNGACI